MDEPRKIGEYEIVEELLHGSLTSIYKAHHTILNRTVLIKKLHQKLMSEADLRDRFIREAQVCAQISHPNIVEVFDFKVSDEATYLVLEYVKGNNLTELMGGEYFPVEIALAILAQIIQGLGFAHAAGIVHRDIKPDNILISEHGIVKISDFGLAFIEGSQSLTRHGMVIGTPAYMSPEQAAGKKIDYRSDIFSVGITAFEMLTGVNPYKSETLTECLRKIISDSVPKLSDYRVDVPVRLEKIIAGIMEKNPGKRYVETEEISKEILEIVTENKYHIGKEVVEKFIRERDQLPPTDRIKISTVSSHTKRRNRMKFLLVSLILIFIIVSIGTVMFYPFQKSPERLAKLIPDSAETKIGKPDSAAVNDSSIIPTKDGKADTLDRVLSNLRTGQPPPGNKKPEKSVEEIVKDVDEEDKANTSAVPEKDNLLELNTTPGKVTFNASPYVHIYIDKEYKGTTPILEPLEIPPGKHEIQYVRTDLGISITDTLNLKSGERKHEIKDFWNHLGRVWIMEIRPWAVLIVDGEILDTIPPFENPLILSLGMHRLEFLNPNFNTYEWVHYFDQGSKPESLYVNLESKGK